MAAEIREKALEETIEVQTRIIDSLRKTILTWETRYALSQQRVEMLSNPVITPRHLLEFTLVGILVGLLIGTAVGARWPWLSI